MKTFLFFISFITVTQASLVNNTRPDDIVDIKKIIPNIKQDIRYFTKRNFLGEEVTGYIAPKCFLQIKAANDLANVQKKLADYNAELIIYDCYRPQMAVNHFVRWAKDIKAKQMKAIFYPEVDKTKLFSSGYIASRSGHSKGNTIDLGIMVKGSSIDKIKKIPLRDCRTKISAIEKSIGVIDMGTHYDCFDEKSHTNNQTISIESKENRSILVNTMKEFGFRNYSKEWWHFSHNKNAYPRTFHNFPVE